MNRLTNEQIILLILIIGAIVVGSGLLLWQKFNNQPIIAGLTASADIGEVTSSDSAVVQGMKKEQPEEKVVVHVAGEVYDPGVYELSGEIRVIDVIEAAGGENSRADLDRLNLAARVYDGEKIYIPASGENDLSSQGGVGFSGVAGGSRSSSSLLNINSATSAQLEQLPGIGPGKAANILEYRRQIGRFKNLDELLDVKGIGEKTLEQIKDELTL